MRSVNRIYKLHLKNTILENEFDIDELDEKIYRISSPAIYSNKGKLAGGESIYTATTQDDYDEKVFQKILKIKPVYNVEDFLNYHYQNYCLLFTDKELFLKHIQYIILPRLHRGNRKTFYDITKEWINKTKEMNLIEQEKENIIFLKKSYEVATEYCPSNPLSVSLNPKDLGSVINFDEKKVSRIMIELVNKGFVQSSLGMLDLFITQSGLDYLRYLENPVLSKQESNINIQNISNSPILIQKDVNNSHQALQIVDYNKEDLKKLVQEVESKIEELSKHISMDEVDELKAEIEYLNTHLKAEAPKQNKLKKAMDEIKNILAAVPTSVIANILSQPMISLLFPS